MKIITINREYCAGGHSIGLEVAKELGLALYDRDIIKAVAKENGIEYDSLAEEDEEISKVDSFIRNITPISYEQKDVIYEAEKQIILDIAKKGPVVFLGHCANSILKEAGYDTLSILLHGSIDSRMKRASELLNTDDEATIRKVLKKRDHARRSYYEYYTDSKFEDYSNYDLSIDTGRLGYEKSIELIVNVARMFK